MISHDLPSFSYFMTSFHFFKYILFMVQKSCTTRDVFQNLWRMWWKYQPQAVVEQDFWTINSDATQPPADNLQFVASPRNHAPCQIHSLRKMSDWGIGRDPKKPASWKLVRMAETHSQVFKCWWIYATFIKQSRACFFLDMKLKKEVTNLYNKKQRELWCLRWLITRSGKRWMCFFWQCVTCVLRAIMVQSKMGNPSRWVSTHVCCRRRIRFAKLLWTCESRFQFVMFLELCV